MKKTKQPVWRHVRPEAAGEAIRARRIAEGLTQEALAGLLGVTRLTLLKWENGQTAPRASYAGDLEAFILGGLPRLLRARKRWLAHAMEGINNRLTRRVGSRLRRSAQ